MEDDNKIKVDCKEITKKGLVCNIDKENFRKMTLQGMEPEHTHFKIQDKDLTETKEDKINETKDDIIAETNPPKSKGCGCSDPSPKNVEKAISESKSTPKITNSSESSTEPSLLCYKKSEVSPEDWKSLLDLKAEEENSDD